MRTRQEIESDVEASHVLHGGVTVNGRTISQNRLVLETLLDLRDQNEQIRGLLTIMRQQNEEGLALGRECRSINHVIMEMHQAQVENERDAILKSAGIQS